MTIRFLFVETERCQPGSAGSGLDMPPFKDKLTAEQIEALALYLASRK